MYIYGNPRWGSIQGSIINQTDLMALIGSITHDPVTLTGKPYLSLTGQQILAEQINLDTAVADHIGGQLQIANGGHHGNSAEEGHLNLWNDGSIPDNGTNGLDKNQYMLLWNKEPGGASTAYGHNIDGFRSEILAALVPLYHPLNAIPLRQNARSSTVNTTLTDADGLVALDCTSGNRTATLPTAVGRTGRVFILKRIDGTANTCTFATTGSQNIDAATTATIVSNNGTIAVQSNGSKWNILYRYLT